MDVGKGLDEAEGGSGHLLGIDIFYFMFLLYAIFIRRVYLLRGYGHCTAASLVVS